MAVKKTTKKRHYTRRQASKEPTVKSHLKWGWSFFIWTKNNPWSFGLFVAAYSFLGSCTLYVGTKVLAPVVVPIAEKLLYTKANKYISYVDSIINMQRLEIDSIKEIITSESLKEEK